MTTLVLFQLLLAVFGHSSTTFDETLKGLEKASESFMLKEKILDPRYNKYKQIVIIYKSPYLSIGHAILYNYVQNVNYKQQAYGARWILFKFISWSFIEKCRGKQDIFANIILISCQSQSYGDLVTPFCTGMYNIA